MEELPETLKRAFPNFENAKEVYCDRTKTTHLINSIIGKVVFDDLCHLMKKLFFNNNQSE